MSGTKNAYLVVCVDCEWHKGQAVSVHWTEREAMNAASAAFKGAPDTCAREFTIVEVDNLA